MNGVVEVSEELHEEDEEEKRGKALGPEEGDEGHEGGPEEVRPDQKPLPVLGVGPGGKQGGEDHGAEELGAQHQGDPEGVFREQVDEDEEGHPVDLAPRLGDQVGRHQAGEGLMAQDPHRRSLERIIPWPFSRSREGEEGVGQAAPFPGQDQGPFPQAVDQEVF